MKIKFKDFLLLENIKYDNDDRLHQKMIDYYKKDKPITDLYLVKDKKLFWLYKQIISMIDEIKKYDINTDDILNISNWGIKQNGNLGIFDIGFGNYFEEFESEPQIININEGSLYKEIIDSNFNKITKKLNINDIEYIDSGFFW